MVSQADIATNMPKGATGDLVEAISEAPGGPVEGIHEGWTIASALAACTHSAEVGQLVTCMSFRDPGLLAKMAVTA